MKVLHIIKEQADSVKAMLDSFTPDEMTAIASYFVVRHKGRGDIQKGIDYWKNTGNPQSFISAVSRVMKEITRPIDEPTSYAQRAMRVKVNLPVSADTWPEIENFYKKVLAKFKSIPDLKNGLFSVDDMEEGKKANVIADAIRTQSSDGVTRIKNVIFSLSNKRDWDNLVEEYKTNQHIGGRVTDDLEADLMKLDAKDYNEIVALLQQKTGVELPPSDLTNPNLDTLRWDDAGFEDKSKKPSEQEAQEYIKKIIDQMPAEMKDMLQRFEADGNTPAPFRKASENVMKYIADKIRDESLTIQMIDDQFMGLYKTYERR